MMLAATMAGVGFGSAGVHIPHACAYPIASMKHAWTPVGYPDAHPFVPHGFSVTVTAPAAFRFTEEASPERHREAATLLGGEDLADTLAELMRDVGAPMTLGELGYARGRRPGARRGRPQAATSARRRSPRSRDSRARADPPRLAVKPGQSETPLATAAAAYLDDPSITPFTTPGHKRSEELADEFLVCDLPLSSGADDLHLTGDVLGRAEALAADLWGADLCRFCVNGSTQGNQALALAVGRPGDRVIVTRGLHKSLFAGLVLAGLEPVWIRPEVDPATGLALALPLARVRDALRASARRARRLPRRAELRRSAERRRRRSRHSPTMPVFRSSSTRPGGRISASTRGCRRTRSRSAPTPWSPRRTRR